MLVGGHVALDLVNTVAWRLDPARSVDRLPDYAALLDWSQRAGVVDQPVPPGDERRALQTVRRLREALSGALAGGDVGALRPVVVDAVRHAELAPGLPLRWVVPLRGPEDLGRRLALASHELLSDAERVKDIRLCADPACGWRFIDRSRSHTRRWCSSGDCGNRERVRRHYARHRSAGAGQVPQKRAGSR